MTSRHDRGAVPVNLGGKYAVGLFVLCLVAFVAETQLAQYVQSNLGFQQPFLIFYIVHSSFAIMLPMHFTILMVASKHSPRALWSGLIFALKKHLSPSSFQLSQSPNFPTRKFMRLLSFLTIGMTVPSLLWFAAIPLAPVTDVTALWNTNAFFAYILTVKIFKLPWHPKRLAAVVLATLGVMAMIYGGSSASDPGEATPEESHFEAPAALSTSGPSAPLVGDLLTLVASIGYGLYQVLYKMYAALPSDPEIHGDPLYTPIATSYEDIADDMDLPPDDTFNKEFVYPPPFALYPNFLTSAIGICTFLFLWIPIPFLHYFGIVHFELPANPLTVLVIAGIALSGVIFNAGFMVLLGVWGPIVTSVGSLLTIVLVFFSDMIFGGAVGTVTPWSLAGSGMIMVAFAVLAYDMM